MTVEACRKSLNVFSRDVRTKIKATNIGVPFKIFAFGNNRLCYIKLREVFIWRSKER